jgi:hypothetical protein
VADGNYDLTKRVVPAAVIARQRDDGYDSRQPWLWRRSHGWREQSTRILAHRPSQSPLCDNSLEIA